MVSTEKAPAKEPNNKERSLGAPILINIEITDNIASPAPTLSTILFKSRTLKN